MRHTVLILTAALLAAPFALVAQTSPSASTSFTSPAFSSSSLVPVAFSDSSLADPSADGGAAAQTMSPMRMSSGYEGPLSRIGFSAGISPLGIQLQSATNLSNHFNLRVYGNFFNYSDNFTTNGINATGKLNLKSTGASIDFYPFHSGFRISPGVLASNGNQVTGNTDVPAGTSFTLNGQTYYSANANAATGATPVVGTGVLGLNSNKPAPSITVGWGNMARGGSHWSFPVDAGVAFIGAPTVKVNLTGWACYDQAQTECTNISDPTNPIAIAIQSNLTTQVAKWTNDLNPLKTYPIVSAGIAYSFHIR